MMNYDEFLDNQKRRGEIVYRCTEKDCNFRGIGRAVTVHTLATGHTCENEDKITPTEKMGE